MSTDPVDLASRKGNTGCLLFPNLEHGSRQTLIKAAAETVHDCLSKGRRDDQSPLCICRFGEGRSRFQQGARAPSKGVRELGGSNPKLILGKEFEATSTRFA